MKTSIFLTATGAILAIASPLLQERNLHTATDVVIEWVTVTVTAGAKPTVFGPGRKLRKSSTTSTTSTTPAPVPEPAPVTVAAIPEPETTPPPAPVEVPVTTEAPAPAPTTAAAKVEPVATQVAPASGDYQDTALYHHNRHRFNHSADALSWGQTYADYAEQVANTCKFAHDLTPGGGGYGQNLAMYGTTSDPESLGASKALAMGVTGGWYNGEINKYPGSNYGNPNTDMSAFHEWGHYSQMVWKETQQVGCFTKYCPPGSMNDMGSWFTVCNYYPPGNMGGGYAANVLPPQGQDTIVV
ncbi:CAP domain-containing protein [Apodospora peruviana]|uniref:CAP domain-containing protein n=1 Tax=Apodospora peruviana TaxID=516989 RepID=A0AAE0MG30_9PEZI|nr:CAP domain-containing protein [Apodospora peruviana]